MEPLVEAATRSLKQLQSDLRDGLTGQSAETLNWRPYPEGNTISGLIAHMYDAGNFLLRSGLGETVVRDREGQFAAAMPDANALLAHVDRSTDNLVTLLARYTADDLARRSDFRGNDTVGAWFVLHVCEHALEHWGQIQTIRDLHKS
jgi:uncharacterized damage-inducible protein DinB